MQTGPAARARDYTECFPHDSNGGLAFASPPWCKVVTTMKRRVTMKEPDRKAMKTQRTSLVRASISFPPDLYETLEGIAKQKKVSLAWVVRDASEKYITEQKQAVRKQRQG
jgi:tRNA (Thr-GGU) A37 N-methylase